MKIKHILDQISFVPHLWLKVERDIPHPIFAVAVVGVPSLLMVGLPRLMSLDTVGKIIRQHHANLRDDNQNSCKVVDCFGRVLGYYYHHQLGRCQEFSVQGEFIKDYQGLPPHYGEEATLELTDYPL